MVHHAVESVRHDAELKELILTESCDAELYVMADPVMIETAIRNVLYNAIKFTPRGGSVTVVVEKEMSSVHIRISDTGIGMSEETIGRLFRPDVKLKSVGTEGEPGTGLGLILCKEYVEKNKGSITVKSVKDSGSTISIHLPLASSG
jgi:signal transduction histidine kinase